VEYRTLPADSSSDAFASTGQTEGRHSLKREELSMLSSFPLDYNILGSFSFDTHIVSWQNSEACPTYVHNKDSLLSPCSRLTTTPLGSLLFRLIWQNPKHVPPQTKQGPSLPSLPRWLQDSQKGPSLMHLSSLKSSTHKNWNRTPVFPSFQVDSSKFRIRFLLDVHSVSETRAHLKKEHSLSFVFPG
jgi:hypothetical protein